MRLPAVVNRNRVAVNSSLMLPSPHGGWNARDSIAAMPSEDAVILDNWLPTSGEIEMRKGYTVHATGMSGQIETIMQWAGPAGEKMFAAVGTEIYEVTSAGAVGAADITSAANAQWQCVMFSTAGGDFLVACNDASADAVQNYDGTTWTTPTLTGAPGTPAGANFNNVMAFKERLFFIEKNSMSYWVLPVKSIAGTAVEVPIGSFTVKGGHLVAQASWTLDGGAGVDDFLVTITSNGEVLVFQGTDPTDANNWAKVGRFNIGRPAGRRCFEKVSGDLLVLTEDGYVSLSRALIASRSNPTEATSDKIRGAVREVMINNRTKFGWQAVLFPKASIILVNVPLTEGAVYQQHVFSLNTRAWARFTGINAGSWGFLSDDLYFGGQGVVYKFWDGLNDNGADIVLDAQQAFSFFKSPGKSKKFLQVRPIMKAQGDITPSIGMSVDFNIEQPDGTAAFAANNDAAWDTTDWDTQFWADGFEDIGDWQGVTGEGVSGGLRMILRANGLDVKWAATDYIYEIER